MPGMFPPTRLYARVAAVATAAVATVVILAGCASTPGQLTPGENFTNTDVYSHSFAGTEQATCEAVRRALLSQGYIVNDARNSLVKARKSFQPERERHVQIEFNVTCAPDSKGSNTTTAFANAVRDQYALKKSSSSASVGVGVLGSVSLPFSSSDEALVKVASETIPSRQFYDRFFELVERYLDDSSVDSGDDARKGGGS